MSRVYQRENTWYIDFRMNGRRYRETAGQAASKDDAMQVMADRRKAVREGIIYGAPPERVTFESFADRYYRTECAHKLSAERDKIVLDMLKAIWPGRMLHEITPAMLAEFVACRRAKRKPATVARDLETVKRAFRVAVDWGLLPMSPARTVKAPKVINDRVRYLTPEEWGKLRSVLPLWLLHIVVFLLFSAARRGEALRLRWPDVDTARGLLTFRKTKAGIDQTIPINRTVLDLLNSLPKPINPAQRVFHVPGADPEKPSTAWGRIHRAWTAACAATGVKDFHLHDLRHTCATMLINRGATLYDVQGYLRHASPKMTQRYAHLTGERREQTARLLDTGLDTKSRPHRKAASVNG